MDKLPCNNTRYFVIIGHETNSHMLDWCDRLKSGVNQAVEGLGPVAQAVNDRPFDRIVILCDYPPQKIADYLGWLKGRTKVTVEVNYENLTSPTNFGEIYEAAVNVISKTIKDQPDETELTFHLSPGTPAMAAVWIILAKTRFPAELIESSKQGGVKTASVPFDISADFLPDLLRRPDERLEFLSASLPPEAPEFDEIVHRSRVMKRVITKAGLINQIQGSEFWENITCSDLETIRKELRGIMHFRSGDLEIIPPKYIDITDGEEEYAYRKAFNSPAEMKAYMNRVEATLKKLFDRNPVLQKIREGRSVSESDLESLTSLVLTQNPDVDLTVLKEFYQDTAQPLDFTIRKIIGMEPEAVKERFAEFARKHPQVTAKQIRFLGLLQNHIAKYGVIEVSRLYDDPFTSIDSNGLDGVFPNESDALEIVAIIETFQPKTPFQPQPNGDVTNS